MYLGIDLGTSGVKALLIDDSEQVVAEATAPLTVQRPQPLWSEQDPAAWWAATIAAVRQIRQIAPAAVDGIEAIGLSGQMHGAVLLDTAQNVLRPAILWNDGRSGEECKELERLVPDLHNLAGNAAMPGFTAPKLLWVAKHEPEIFARMATVLLPKDWLRLKLTGEAMAEISDAAGTLWLDVAARRWSPEVLAACGMDVAKMPPLVEGSAPAGRLTASAAGELGLKPGILCAGGGADNAAAAIGLGVVDPGRALLSLGTSGVMLSPTLAAEPNALRGLHAFCHAVPARWYRMGVILSAASSLGYAAKLLGADEATLVAEAASVAADPRGPIFLPYLSGERTPHNDPLATGVLAGLTHETSRGAITRAVLEGVAFAIADAQDLVGASGEIYLVGGGSKSELWARILASTLGAPMLRSERGEYGPALGAARLGRLARTGEDPSVVCTPPRAVERIDPDPREQDVLAANRQRFMALYPSMKNFFGASA